jgi:hypothetical protein
LFTDAYESFTEGLVGSGEEVSERLPFLKGAGNGGGVYKKLFYIELDKDALLYWKPSSVLLA